MTKPTDIPVITLGQRPAYIAHDVIATTQDGATIRLPVRYTYRTRRELGALQDSQTARARAEAQAAMDELQARQAAVAAAIEAGTDLPPVPEADTQAAIEEAVVQATADYLQLILQGWGLPSEMTRDALVDLADGEPGVVRAIVSDYRRAITEGRRGN
jgi:hypothetical protein